ncbi:MAG: RNA polymerase sigma factor [Solirubrobacteraceae bacterium]
MPLLRLRSDEQLVAAFRAGSEEAFSAIHDRYRPRLFAYARQMLAGSRQDAEDACQEVFVRAYRGLRTSNRKLALRAWLYRVAHNRCIDELRRPPLPGPELLELSRGPVDDPFAIAEQRDELRRLIADVRRLPEQQRSALLMRELSDMSYAELAVALDVTIPAVKSLLVRARIGLARAAEARDVACEQIREQLTLAHDRGVRPTGTSRRHLRDCDGCREFRRDMRGVTKQLAALTPAVGPGAVLAKLVGFGGGGGAAAGSGAAVGGGVAVAGGTGGLVTAGGLLGGSATHIAAILAAAALTAGGAVEVENTLTVSGHPHHRAVQHGSATSSSGAEDNSGASGSSSQAALYAAAAGLGASAANTAGSPPNANRSALTLASRTAAHNTGAQSGPSNSLYDMTVPPGTYATTNVPAGSTPSSTATGSGTTGGAGTGSSSGSAGAGGTTPASAGTPTGSGTAGSSSGTGSGTPSAAGSAVAGSSASGTGSGTASGTGSSSSTAGTGSSSSSGTSSGTSGAGTGSGSSSAGSGSGSSGSGSVTSSGSGSGSSATGSGSSSSGSAGSGASGSSSSGSGGAATGAGGSSSTGGSGLGAGLKGIVSGKAA